jgi:hypothetical protein
VVAAVEEDLSSALGERFVDFLVEFIEGDDIGVGVTGDAVEGAELAVDVTDIGVIDVTVDNIGNDVVALVIEGGGFGEVSAVVGEDAEFVEGELVEFECVLGGDSLTVPDFLDDRVSEFGDHGGSIALGWVLGDVVWGVDGAEVVFIQEFREALDSAAFILAEVVMDMPGEVIASEVGCEFRLFLDERFDGFESERFGFTEGLTERGEVGVSLQDPDCIDEREAGEVGPCAAEVPG